MRDAALEPLDDEAVVEVLVAVIGDPRQVEGVADREHRLAARERFPPLGERLGERADGPPLEREAGPLGEELRQAGRRQVEPRQAVRAVAQVEAPVEREGRANVGEAGVREEQRDVVGDAVEVGGVDAVEERRAARGAVGSCLRHCVSARPSNTHERATPLLSLPVTFRRREDSQRYMALGVGAPPSGGVGS